MTHNSQLRRVVPADPAVVFAAITGLAELPEWNDAMTRMVELPERLEPGAEWVVEFRALGSTWQSRSTARAVDGERGVFGYRSQTDDGNPSYAEWEWTVRPHSEGSEVTVAWSIHPKTFWRRVLLARIREVQLRRTEVPASFDALTARVGVLAARGGAG